MTGFLLLFASFASGCSGGAVVFAPTPPPPDLSPVEYVHPSGAFAVVVPRNWSVYEQNVTTLATAAFAPPDADEPPLLFAVINPGQDLDSAAFADIINQYQTQARPDVGRYKEESRQAMGDGSWRMTGLRRTAAGATQQVNTFIQRSGALIGVADVVIPDDPNRLSELQTIVNTFTVRDNAALQPASLAAFAYATPSSLNLLHVSTWTTREGVFYITGEVANSGGVLMTDVPVRATLKTADGLSVADASDIVMGYGIPPGGFMPFSLRFGQGQPSLTHSYELALGSADWQPDPQRPLLDPDALAWTDESTLDSENRLIIRGTVTNAGDEPARDLRAVVTIFDSAQNVIAAAFTGITPAQLAPGETADFGLIIAELGGQPANYIVTVQGLLRG